MAQLSIVGTPIGNLEDMTYRAVRVLGEADAVLAEDTRVTKKLFERYDIRTPLLTWHEHSDDRDWQRIRKLFEQGRTIAYVTDAGTPGVSDPGGKLIARVLEEFPATAIVAIPGVSALTAAISVAGIPLDEFLF